VFTHMDLLDSVVMLTDICVIETNKTHFSFFIYSDNLTSTLTFISRLMHSNLDVVDIKMCYIKF
jgi:hypothetical protein